MRQRVMDLIV